MYNYISKLIKDLPCGLNKENNNTGIFVQERRWSCLAEHSVEGKIP